MTLFQVGKQFDALLVDTSASAFDTFESDTGNVSKANLKLLLKFKAFLCRISSNTHSHKAKKGEGEPGRETGARGVARGGFRGFRKPPLESVILIVTYHSDSAIRSH